MGAKVLKSLIDADHGPILQLACGYLQSSAATPLVSGKRRRLPQRVSKFYTQTTEPVFKIITLIELWECNSLMEHLQLVICLAVPFVKLNWNIHIGGFESRFLI